MANRLYDGVIAVDSSMGNLPIVGGTSANIGTFRISGIAFWAANTLGNCIISGVNTLDMIVQFSIVNAGSGIVNSTQSISFSVPLVMSSIKCPTLTAGTAWVYLA